MRSPGPSSQRPHRTRRPSYKVRENADCRSRSTQKRLRSGLLGWQPRTRKATTRVEVVVPTLRQIDARLAHDDKDDSNGTPRTSSGASVRRERGESQEQLDPPLQIKSEGEEEENAKLYFLLQAQIKVEVKPEEVIPENVVRDRLALIGYDTLHLKVPQDLLDVTTTRDVTSRIWGGSLCATFPKIGKEFTHGLDDFMYASLLYDPHAPRWPGSPGLIFKFRDDGEEWPEVMRLIVRLRDNAWQYMGQYKLMAAPPLAPDEWNAQSHQVKRRWAIKLSERKLDGGLKAKIVLRRRLGRDPLPEEVTTALRSGEKLHVGAEEILRACKEGRAVVHVWCIKCIGYDVDFQRRIAAGR